MSFTCMLTHSFDPKRVKTYPVVVEEKFDGVRALIVVKPGEEAATCFSRAGKEFTSVNNINALIAAQATIGGFVLDGELDCGTFNETVSFVRRKNQEAETAIFRAFDVLTYEEWVAGRSDRDWVERREVLEQLVADIGDDRVVISPYKLANDADEVYAMNREMIDNGREGVIVKLTEGIYRNGRTYEWMKLKDEKSEDLKVIGVFEGEGKYVGTTGGIIVDFNGVDVKVGTGFTDKDRHDIWKRHHEENSVLGQTAEVTYQEKTIHGSLRHPAFKGFRIDK